MTSNETPIDAGSASNNPRSTRDHRSAITGAPAARIDGRSAIGRRIRDLYAALMSRLDQPADIVVQADVLALAELKCAAEVARQRLLEGGERNSNEIVRLENLVRRAEARVGLLPGGAERPPETLEAYLQRTDPGLDHDDLTEETL